MLWSSAAVVGVALWPQYWRVLLAAVLADHLLLTALGLWPRSQLLGPNRVRLPKAAASRRQVALTFDDGPDPEVTPAVLEILQRYGARASFFCGAERALAHPDLVREIERRGHSVENHSWRHSHWFSLYGPWRLRRELVVSQRILAGLCRSRPRFFRAPAGLRNPLLDAALNGADLELVSWTRRGFDTACTDPQRVLRRLTGRLRAGDILLLHDGHAARTAQNRAVVLEVLPRLLDGCAERDLTPVSLPMACASVGPSEGR